MPNLERRSFGRGWWPSADSQNGPPDALLRADNLILDEAGALALRYGSSTLYTLTEASVNELFTTIIDGTEYVFASTDTRVFKNGVDLGFTLGGTGDASFGDMMGQVFMARQTSKKKWDPTGGVQTWGIEAPGTKPTVTAVDAVSRVFASCASTESPAFSANEGSTAFTTGYDGTANGAIQCTPARATGRSTITKTYASDTDFFNFSGTSGQDNDLFDMLVAVDKPEDLISITVMMALNGSAGDPFRDDHYYFDFNIGDLSPRQGTVAVKNSAGIVGKVKQSAADNQLDVSADPTENGDPLDINDLLAKLDKPREREGRSRERKDTVASPAWFHLSVPRGQFNRVGNTSGKNWSKVKALKLIARFKTGSTGTIAYDNVQMYGGGDRILTGSFKFRYRLVRNNGTYVEKSPPSPASDVQVFNAQAARVTIPFAELQGLESGVNECWIYMYGGYMDAYYRVGVTGTVANDSSMRILWFARSADGSITAVDRTRFTNMRGLSIPGVSSGGDLVVDILTSEIDAIAENEKLEAGCVVPPDNIVAIEGDYLKRMWLLTDDGFLYPSRINNPCVYNVLHALRVGDPSSTPYWLKKTSGGLFVGTSEDIYRITGTGDEFLDGTIDLHLDSVNVGNPPVDKAVASEGNFIVYRSDDGWRVFTGAGSEPVPRAAVDLLWQGQDRHGVSAVNRSGRFRATLQRQVLTIITPEGVSDTSSTALHRYDFSRGLWYRHTYPQAFAAISSDSLGRVILGSTNSLVVQIDTGTSDNGTGIGPVLWTKADDDGVVLRRKDPVDLMLDMDSGGGTVTVALHLDGSASAALSYSASSDGSSPHKKDVTAVSAFRRVQFRLSGSLTTFKLRGLNLYYRARPQTRMAADTGYVQPPGSQDLANVREVRMRVNTPNDLQVLLYLGDTLFATKTVTIGSDANKTVVKTVRFADGAFGYTTRCVVKTTNSANYTEVGFELYWLEIEYWPTGNQTSKPKTRVSFNEGAGQTVAPTLTGAGLAGSAEASAGAGGA